jgi:CMP-N-acetylneuraminic acid synthetase|tara:strand:- start:1077 stop:1811 length:735 start_codon:yes stop_codon:yes gene_type:complete
MKKLKVYAMIPARLGSTRLKMKNLALIDGKPMISYAINAAVKSGVFDKVIVNSEHNIFSDIANRYKVDFYHRPEDLGSSVAKSDAVVADFMQSYPEADIVAWVNPIAPFQTHQELLKIISYFLKHRLDSLITVEEMQVHCNYKGHSINYDKDGMFAQTQELSPVEPFVYSLMMWRRNAFLSDFINKGFSLFCGKFETYSVKKTSGIIIKTAEDLKLADLLMRAINSEKSDYLLEYDELVSNEYK